MPKIPFNDRPHKNEKQESIDYVKSLIEQARTDARDSDIPKLEKLIQLLNSKKYGLVWEEHAEFVEDEMKKKIPVFVEDESKKINDNPNSEDFNFLLEGDNLHSLHLLEKTHLGKIDVIYIDPPYNTGAKNWKYNNAFVDSKDEFRHSKWISFMNARLKIAKKLLKDSGIIVLTIDDYEIENITLLMNEIFGEKNHLGTVVIKNNPQGRSSVTGFQISHEYALFFGGEKAKIGRLPRTENQVGRYKNKDKYGLFEWRNFRAQYSSESPKMVYPIFVKMDGSDFRIPKLKWNNLTSAWECLEQPKQDEIISMPIDNEGRMRTWKWSIDTLLKNKENEMGVRLDRNKVPSVYYKGRMKTEGMLPYTFWDDPKYSASTFGANLLSEFIGRGKFNYPKSLYAVEDCIRVASGDKKNSLIFDFFAGSGTTGHAVANLNAEDSGNRRFILATNNENNIAEEVTYERMKRVSAGTEKYEANPMNLKYLKTDFIVKQDFPDVSLEYELLKYITPLVELEFAVDIANPKVQIVITDEQLESLIKNDELVANATLFMHSDIFRDAEQNQILSDLQIKVQEIPNYFFGMELWSK